MAAHEASAPKTPRRESGRRGIRPVIALPSRYERITLPGAWCARPFAKQAGAVPISEEFVSGQFAAPPVTTVLLRRSRARSAPGIRATDGYSSSHLWMHCAPRMPPGPSSNPTTCRSPWNPRRRRNPRRRNPQIRRIRRLCLRTSSRARLVRGPPRVPANRRITARRCQRFGLGRPRCFIQTSHRPPSLLAIPMPPSDQWPDSKSDAALRRRLPTSACAQRQCFAVGGAASMVTSRIGR